MARPTSALLPSPALTALATVALVSTPGLVQAQTFLPDPVEETTFLVEWERPFLGEVEGLSFYSSTLDLDVVVPLGDGLSLDLGAPLAFAGADEFDDRSLVLGNVRASLLFGEADDLDGYVGVTLPTASDLTDADFAVLVGLFPHLDRLEDWFDDAVSLRGAVIPSWELETGARLGLRLGGVIAAPTEFDDADLWARAAAWGLFPAGEAELRADLSGSYLVSEDNGFGVQSVFYLDVGAQLPEVTARPGVFVRIPVDDQAREALDVSLGLRFAF